MLIEENYNLIVILIIKCLFFINAFGVSYTIYLLFMYSKTYIIYIGRKLNYYHHFLRRRFK
jgi:hypothetical protein